MVKLIDIAINKEIIGIKNFLDYQRLMRDPQVKQILTVWENITDFSGNVIDRHLMVIMPIYHSDTIESLVKRYAWTFPTEVDAFLKNLELDRVFNENGWTEQRSMRFSAKIPDKLYRSLEFLHEDFFNKENLSKNMARLKSVCPKLVCGNV